ncbi:NusB domain-containing protein [Heracleum sosnowskyi]|uniref:NusB domain-containing protein n=1 Tax=Heracleum sosnowskyi TaxID=360622 RepID=A0AAD8M1F2_9APIA|nr:NusB domain-containing protein [Heracleum sosnowskyi]
MELSSNSLLVSSSSSSSSCSCSLLSITKPPQFLSLNSISLLSSSCSTNLKCNYNNPTTLMKLPPHNLLRTNAIALDAHVSSLKDNVDDVPHLPKLDKSGRFCSPRAARELALSILYASCLQGSDPVRLFDHRVNARREVGYEFHKAALLEYNHMSFGGPPVSADTVEEADKLLQCDIKVSEMEAEVLSAPPKLVYSKLILRFTRKLLVAVVESWDSHVMVIDKVVPQNWRNEPAGKILELSILHLAMADISVLGTRHQIVINEAVDLAKRFCDGAAPRIINGCLRTFVKDREVTDVPRGLLAKQTN